MKKTPQVLTLKKAFFASILPAIFSALPLFFPLLSYGQEPPPCGTDEAVKEMHKKDPGYKMSMEKIEKQAKEYLLEKESPSSAPNNENTATIKIPVVFHIIYNKDPENISDALIQQQLASLNADFRRLNADAANLRPIFQHLGADTKIEFCLATRDPNGYATSGITRTYTYKNSFPYYGSYINDMKFDVSGGRNGWPPEHYLNIWICNVTGVMGFAYFPGLTNKSLDGAVVKYDRVHPSWFRILTHEVGHYLNLRHIWGDGNCSTDDGVDDTPMAGNSNTSCPTNSPNSCIEPLNDLPDLYEDYMDYTYGTCMNTFTAGQSTRMNALFQRRGYRNSLLSSPGCGGGIPNPCPAPANIVYAQTTNNDMLFQWDAVSGAATYNIRTSVGGGAWILSNVSGNSFTFPNMTNCKNSFQIQAVCSGVPGVFSNVIDFPVPEDLYASNITSNSVTFNWKAVPGATGYNLHYKEINTTSWVSVGPFSGTSTNINNLTNNTRYEWRVAASCSGNWSKFYSFIAGQNVTCGVPTGLINNDFSTTTTYVAWLKPNNAESYNVRIRPAGSSVWTDATTNLNFYYYTNLSSCSAYEFQVESNCAGGTSGYSASYYFTSAGCCKMPTGTSLSNITASGATLTWTSFWPFTNALSYNVRIRKMGATTWTAYTTSGMTYSFANLSPCTNYEYETESVCSGSSVVPTATVSFTTLGCTPICSAPTGLYESNIKQKNAILNWGAVSGASSYEVKYWQDGSSSITTLTPSGTSVSLSGLGVNKKYFWKVRAYCTSVWSEYSGTESFIAGVAGSEPGGGGDLLSIDEDVISEPNTISLQVIPVPTTGKVRVSFNSGRELATHIAVIDLQGREVMKIQNDPTNSFDQEIDLSHLANGLYLLTIQNNGRFIKSTKLIKGN